MGKSKKKKVGFEPSGFFAWRSPLLPFEELLAFGAGLSAPAAVGDGDELESALTADRALLRERLRAVVDRPEVREALFVASPDLNESIGIWREKPEGERGQKVERSLMRYFARMAGRATPFGLFSGCSVGTLDRETELRLEPKEAYGRHTRLDMEYLNALTDAVAADPETRKALLLRPNSSLYRSSRYFRYVEGSLEPTSRIRDYSLSSVEVTDYLEATLGRASNGAFSADLVAALAADDPEVTEEEGALYVDELIENQILLPELQPVVTGTEAIDDLIDRFGQHPHLGHIRQRLDEARATLRGLDDGGLGGDPATYVQVAGQLEDLPAEVRLPRLFQVDMVKPSPAATLGRAIVRDVEQGVEMLRRLAPPPGDGPLVRFRNEFMTRYEGQEVPLVQALDEELGIGFERADDPSAEASPLLEGLAFPPPPQTPQARMGRREGGLLRLLSKALRDGAKEISLTDDDINALVQTDQPQPLPDAFSVMAEIAASSSEAVQKGDYLLLLGGCSGPSGARLLGRFCHADPVLTRHVLEHLRAEEALRPDAIFAEVVHLPEGRIGNILFRPVLRSHEIPFLGRSGADPEQQIPITDLWVSIAGGRIVLRSRKLDREVIPRLTSAHNYSMRSLGIYRFLCSLQSQEVVPGAGWSWYPFEGSAYLPRVVYGRLVLERATWNLAREEIEPIGKAKGAQQFEALQRLRERQGWPRWVVVADGDNELPVDLDNILAVQTFTHLIKNRSAVTIAELYPGPGDLCAHGPEGHFLHQLVLPFVRKGPAQKTLTAVTQRSTARRLHTPGSEYLYAKLYTGTSTADQVLAEVVRPVVDEVMPAGLAHRWFFIRYSEQGWHVRLRFIGDPSTLQTEVLPRIERAAEPLLASGQIWRFQLDTYEPEVSRYGGSEDALRLAEQVFWADSECVLSLVERLEEEEDPHARWRLTLYGVHRLLVDLGLDLPARMGLMKNMRISYGNEFNVDVLLKRQLGNKYRAEKDGLTALIGGAMDTDETFAPWREIFDQRSARITPVVKELARVVEGSEESGVPSLAGSFVHMYTNRLLRSAARAQELVLYDFLGRLYATQKAHK